MCLTLFLHSLKQTYQILEALHRLVVFSAITVIASFIAARNFECFVCVWLHALLVRHAFRPNVSSVPHCADAGTSSSLSRSGWWKFVFTTENASDWLKIRHGNFCRGLIHTETRLNQFEFLFGWRSNSFTLLLLSVVGKHSITIFMLGDLQ